MKTLTSTSTSSTPLLSSSIHSLKHYPTSSPPVASNHRHSPKSNASLDGGGGGGGGGGGRLILADHNRKVDTIMNSEDNLKVTSSTSSSFVPSSTTTNVDGGGENSSNESASTWKITVFVWSIFLILLPLLPIMILFDVCLHWILGVKVVFPWQVDFLSTNDDCNQPVASPKSIEMNDKDQNVASVVRQQQQTRRRHIPFDEIIDVRSPSEFQWFRMKSAQNVPFNTDVMEWKNEYATTKYQNDSLSSSPSSPRDSNTKIENEEEILNQNSEATSSRMMTTNKKLIVCMSGHRSPFMAYLLMKNAIEHQQQQFNENNIEFYNLYGGMILWKLYGKDCSYG